MSTEVEKISPQMQDTAQLQRKVKKLQKSFATKRKAAKPVHYENRKIFKRRCLSADPTKQSAKENVELETIQNSIPPVEVPEKPAAKTKPITPITNKSTPTTNVAPPSAAARETKPEPQVQEVIIKAEKLEEVKQTRPLLQSQTSLVVPEEEKRVKPPFETLGARRSSQPSPPNPRAPQVSIEISSDREATPPPTVHVVTVDIEHSRASIISDSSSHDTSPFTPLSISANVSRAVTPSFFGASGGLGIPTHDLDTLSVASSISFRSSVSSRSSHSSLIDDRLKSLRDDIRRRTSLVKRHVSRAASPTISEKSSVGVVEKEQERKNSLRAFVTLEDPPTRGPTPYQEKEEWPRWKQKLAKPFRVRWMPKFIDRQKTGYLAWLGLVTLCFLFNAFGIPLRSAYPYQTEENVHLWLMADYFCDFIYLVDMIVVKPRISFMKGGLAVKDSKQLAKWYLTGVQFKLDLVALAPLDLLYFKIGIKPYVRFPRILKLLSYWEFLNLLDKNIPNPVVLRISRTMSYMFYIIHVNSCVYYSFSAWQAFGQIGYRTVSGGWEPNRWVYNNEGIAYIRCFYFTTKLATSIGNNPSPTNVIEFVYMAVSWMLGVFVFALLLGQIRDIVANASRNREIFRNKMDTALQHCKRLKVPKETENRVRDWFMYTWQQQKTLDENHLIEKLPRKLQTDLAISVHYQILSKVQLFQDAEVALLRDLVLKLKPVLFLPGDYVCEKGEVGKEMYIIGKGFLEVVGGPNNSLVFATLKEGTVFGEISLLAIGGGNRRTASVRSKGFSNLFVLSKDDLGETIQDYPDAQKMLKQKAKKMLKKDAKKEEESKEEEDLTPVCEIHPGPSASPKMMHTVVQMLDPKSATAQKLREAMEAAKEAQDDDGASVASLKGGQILRPPSEDEQHEQEAVEKQEEEVDNEHELLADDNSTKEDKQKEDAEK